MFKSFRPEPVSPFRNRLKKKLLFNDAALKTGAEPNRTINADLFLSTTDNKSISNMKIFDEANNEGMPHTWMDNLKQFKNYNPSIYDSLHSATLRPEMHPPQEKLTLDFFNKRNKMRLFSATRKVS
jgi:hypothetical protein